jgi:ubiquinone/menaquinone biosynthesis C-methylase UbiE
VNVFRKRAQAGKPQYEKLKRFFDQRAREYGKMPFHQLAIFTHDPDKDRIERDTFEPLMRLQPDMSVLDLGCGVGRWCLRLAGRARRVVGVDFSQGLLEVARQEAAKRGIKGIEFRQASLPDLSLDEHFDLVLLLGVLCHFEDEDLELAAAKTVAAIKRDGRLLAREAVAVGERLERREGDYLIIYRPADDYVQLFERAGLRLLDSDLVYPGERTDLHWPGSTQRYFLYETTA